MAGIWDSNFKRLIAAHPQHFVTWLMPGATIKRELPAHLNRALDADTLYEVARNGSAEGIHVEIQRHNDTDMAGRAWKYNVFASRKHKLTFVSYILYLKKDGKIVSSPFKKSTMDGRDVHHFYFVNIKLWEIPTEHLRQLGLLGLLPLLPLTCEGTRPEVVEEVITALQQEQDATTYKNLLTITWTLASLAFESASAKDNAWLVRRFSMYRDILHDTPIYKLIMQEEADEEAQKQTQKELQNLRNLFLQIVKRRFSDIFSSATISVAAITDRERLNALIVEATTVQTKQDLLRLLSQVESKKHSYKNQ